MKKRQRAYPPMIPLRRLTRYEAMRNLDLFSAMPDSALGELAKCGKDRRVRKDGLILPHSEVPAARNPPQLMVLLEGEAVVTWGAGSTVDLFIRTLEPGDFAGHIELFDVLPSGSTVRAASDVRCVTWPRESILKALEDCPAMALGFLAGMARQQRHLQRRVAGICSQRAPRRLARTLTALFEDKGIRLKDADGRRCLLLQRPPTRRRMGEIAGVARETVSRLMGQWEECGWIAESEGDLIVRDERELRRVAGA